MNSNRLRLALVLLVAASAHAQTQPATLTTPAATTTAATPLLPAVQMAEVQVLGSRIHRTDEGPAPVSSFDRDYILATGAMTLADFMNSLPQNYTGIGSGRASAPNELNPEFAQRTDTTTPAFNFVLGSSAAQPGQTGVNGVSLRGLGAGSTLVLIDGRRMVQSGVGNAGTDSRQSFVDLNGIPLGMIERIEVITDGSSAIYGADAVAGVVNIVLKKNWSGSELTGSYKGAQHGGGHERTSSFTSGFTAGALSGSVSIDYYSRGPLKASQRSFSKEQDHRTVVAGWFNATGAPLYGRDLRLNWGYPGIVQARTGFLPGFTGQTGGPTAFALVKDGITGNATLANFTGIGITAGSTNTRANTARYLDLIPASERYGIGANFTYKLGNDLEFYGRANSADTRGKFDSQAAVSSASASSGFGNFGTIVPALINGVANVYNPFGTDVLVGLTHYEFGPTYQTTHSKTEMALVGLRGHALRSWRWDLSMSWQNYAMHQVNRLFNGAAITAALANPDVAQRLNPFVDARVAGIKQAAIYETMARYNTVDSTSSLRSVDFSADGELYRLPGGSVKMALGGSFDSAANDQSSVNNSEAVAPVTTRSFVDGARQSQAFFAEASVPIFGKPNALPGLRRLDFQVAGRYENRSPFSKSVPKYSLSWVPVQPVLLRASYSEGFRAPALTEYEVANTVSTTTITDPRRTPASTSGVQVTRGANSVVSPETSTNKFAGLVFEPPFAKGLNFQANYYRTEQKNVIQVISAQNMVNNETLFTSRITRAAPTAADTAANQPGQLTAVNQTFVNFGLIYNESMDYGVDYTLPWEKLGRWRLSLNASRNLSTKRQLAPNTPAVILDDDTAAPPNWSWQGTLFWRRGNLSANAFVRYLSGFNVNSVGNALVGNTVSTTYFPTPAVTSLDLRGGYEFKTGVWRGYLKGLRINAGVGNVFDKKPPFSDTIYGFNAALHSFLILGRSYELSFRQAF